MPFTATRFPMEELRIRHEKCQSLMAELLPQASGIIVFSRTNIYYLTGTRANGLLWLPRSGAPVLMVRKATERCRLESPLTNITSFKSYTQIPSLCADFGVPLEGNVGVEMRALTWSLAQMLESRLTEYNFIAGDAVLDMARSTKSPYEIERIQYAATMQHAALSEHILNNIAPGMNEQEIASAVWKCYFSLGHGGMLRKQQFGAEIFLGGIATGKNSLLPPTFSGMSAYKGEHPAIPHMGYAGSVWQKNTLLTIDTGFTWEGYHSDMAVTIGGGAKNALTPEAHEAHAQCYNFLEHVIQQVNSAVNMDLAALKNILHSAQSEVQQKNPHFVLYSHGVGLNMDEELLPLKVSKQDLHENSVILALHPCISIENQGTVGIKTLFTFNAKGLHSLTPLAPELPCIEDR